MPTPYDGDPSSARVGVVISAFAPENDLVNLVEAVLRQVERVVVVDDTGEGVTSENRSVLDACARIGAVVLRHRTNSGIGAALNTGVRALRESEVGCEFVITLDQDSSLPPTYVARLIDAYRVATARGFRTAMVAPQVVAGVGTTSRRTPSGIWIGSEPIQSGLLLPTSVFDELGLYDESLFIDSVDSDFYLRAKSAGFVCVVAEGLTLGHTLGAKERVTLGPWVLHVGVAADFRYYYMVRNLVAMALRHGRHETVWTAHAIAKLVRHLLVTTALVPGRRRRLSHAFAGFKDGVMRLDGPMPRRARTGTDNP